MMTLEQFYKSYKGKDNLYIVWNNGKCLYVGISAASVWNRWFRGMSPHMLQNSGGHWRGDYSTPIGEHIIHNMPESWQWNIELRRVPEKELRNVESDLIRAYQPPFNTIRF